MSTRKPFYTNTNTNTCRQKSDMREAKHSGHHSQGIWQSGSTSSWSPPSSSPSWSSPSFSRDLALVGWYHHDHQHNHHHHDHHHHHHRHHDHHHHFHEIWLSGLISSWSPSCLKSFSGDLVQSESSIVQNYISLKGLGSRPIWRWSSLMPVMGCMLFHNLQDTGGFHGPLLQH